MSARTTRLRPSLWSRVCARSRQWQAVPVWVVSIAACGLLLALAGCGNEPTPVTLGPLSATSGQVFQSGQPASVVLPGGMQSPDAADISISMTPLGGGTSLTIQVQTLTGGAGGTSVLTFTIPTLSITSPTQYLLVANGKTAMSAFTTSPALQVTVLPGPGLLSVSPATAATGATVDVTITGVSTNWVSGTTVASFGAGISVGGGAEGAAGPVQVNSSSVAVAHLVIDSAAVAGTRNVIVNTGSQNLTLNGGFTVTAGAKPPVASAGGPYVGTTGLPVAFSAAGSSDPAGLALTYFWNFGDGSTGAGVAPTHAYAAAGKYTVTLTATNTAGASANASTTATVTDASKPPIANAGGPYTGVAGTALSFNGAGSSDPKGEALTYSWTFGDGGTATGAAPAHTYASAGTYAVSLTVTNTDNLSATATTAATVSAAPQPPVANAGGPYTGSTAAAISFSGAGSSDPKGEALTYSWTFGDGGTATGVSPTHTYAAAGTFTVTLKVTNTDNQSATITTTATVTAPQMPVANAGGAYTGSAGVALQFSGAGSTDPHGETLSDAWTFGDGGTGTGATPVHTYAASGTFTVTLKVTNTDSLSSTATTTATIGTAAQQPVANAGGPYSGTTGTAVAFSGAASSDPKGEALTYAWNFGDGSTGSGATTSHIYTTAGTFTVTLKVTNTDNLSSTATATAVISLPPQPPVANAGGPYSGVAGTAVAFSGTASSDPKNEALTYAWSFGDGGTATGATPSHTYTTIGSFTVTLKVTNTDNLSATATTTATITGAPPVASAGGPYSGTAGTAVSINGSGSSDPRGETLTYAWTFGDGSTAAVASPTHTYATAGTYTVSLKVTNTDNLSSTATTTATIAAAPPVANAGGPYSGMVGAAVSFNGTASSDPRGETLTYAWSFGDGTTGTGATPTHTYISVGSFTVTLKVTNTDNLSATATTTATIAGTPPIANAGGPYSGTVVTTINFNGSGSSDPRGEALTYTWSFGDGSSGTGATPTHNYTTIGSYTVTLKVTNTDNLSATATTTATVAGAPPVANAGGPYSGTAGTVVSFNGSGSSDPRGETLTYAWAFGDGTTGTGATPSHIYTAPGTFTVTLTVTNTDNLSASATATATIAAMPQAPTANVGGPYSGTAGVAISFNGSGSSDPKNETLTYAWTFGDGGTATGATPTHIYAASGSYTVTLTVSNTDNLNGSATTTATIAAAPQSPTASAGGPYTGTAGQAVTFSGSGSSDPRNETLTYAWNFGDGSTGTGVAPSHTYAASGTFTVSLTVTNTDSLSATSTTTATIAVAAQAPVANAGGPYTGTAGTAVTFSGTNSSDPKGETLTYSWNFGDGSSGTGATTNHTYATSGSFTVTLTVTNTDNLSAMATTTATIAAATQAPTASAGGPYTGVAGTAITFSGSGSSDPKGETLTYAWSFGDGGTATGVAPTYTYSAAGTYTVTLTVTNTDNLTASATATATISSPSAQPPVPSAGGPYTGAVNKAIVFNASGSTDPKNESLTYSWSFGDGASATGAMPSHTYVAAGSYTVTVTVTNTDQASASASTTAVISAPAVLAPVENLNGPYTSSVGDILQFNASGSYDTANQTAGTSGLTLAWDFGDGSQGSGPSPVHTYTTAGNFTVTLTAQNPGGATSTATTTAAIAAGTIDPTSPTAVTGGPYTGKAGVAVSFNGNGSSDPNNLALTYSWDFGDGSGTITGAQPTHTYAAGGTFSVTLTVYNGTTLASASTVATIAAAAPLAGAVANPGGPYTFPVLVPIHLDGTGSTDPNGAATLQYTWDFGDGSQGTGPMPLHVYVTKGTYTISLTVTDAAGGLANAKTTATITAPPAETLTASAGGPYTGVSNQSITLDASGTTDNLGNPPTYSWNFGDGSTGTGQSPAHMYSTAGSYTATVTATSNSVTSTATATVTVATAVLVQITSPTANALFSANTTTVTGTLSAPGMSVSVNGIAATVSGSSFTASGVSLREGVNLLTATATGSNNSIGNGSVSVIMDATAPGISIVTPASGSSLTSSNIAVSGLVNDIVTGSIGSNDVTVTVNGVPAQVSNRSYMLPGVTLVPGVNTITVVATDKVGNASQVSETVTLLPPNAQLALTKISGDAQTGLVQSVLPQPLVVQLLSSTGVPVVGRPITFTVTRSDGTVEVLPNQAQTLAVNSDATGKASVLLQLGSRAGLGVNQVTVTTPGAGGQAVFLETSTVGAPSLIKSVLGETQRGLLGEALAEGFQVLVQDAQGNAVPGVPVNFTVNTGGGTLDNASPVTDSNGKATATLTLGQQEGINNYAVTADFTGDTGQGVTFIASGFAAGPVSATSVSGTVLDSSNSPVVNATVRLLNTTLSTVTNASGNFTLSGAPVGTVTLSVDGSTSSSTQTLPFLSFVLQDLPGQNNTLGKPIFLPSIDVNDAQTVGGDDPVTLTMAGVPGVAFTIAPHSVTFPDGTTVGKLSLSQVKADMVPMAPVNGSGPDLIWTLQPAGTRFSVPVSITLPNTQGLPPGTVQEFYQYDHDLEQFVSAGTSHVSADGSVATSDPGFGITKAGWGEGGIVVTSSSCGISCVSTNPCINSVRGRGCVCITSVNLNYACGTPKTEIGDGVYAQLSGCQEAGYCNADGSCSGMNTPAGTNCDPHDVCYGGSCNGRGTCIPVHHIDDVNTNSALGGTFATNFQVTTEFFAKKIKTLIEGFTPKNWININLNPQASHSSKIIHCCEELQKVGTEIDEDTAGFQVTVQASQIPVLTPAEVPLGIKVPDGEVFGLYVQPGGQFTLSGTHHTDMCNSANNCVSATLGFGVTLAGGLNLPAGILNINVNVATGLGGSIGGGCGTVGYTLGVQPIVLTGQLKIFTYGTFTETYTYVPSSLQFTGTTPLPSF